MNSRLSRVPLVVALALGLLVPTLASAQTRDPSLTRTLNGHRFIPSALIGDPFISTLVRTETGGGIASKVSRDIQNPALDSLIQKLVGDIAFMTLAFEYQYALTDWLALSAEVSGAARIGTGPQSVLSSGITSMFGAKFRATARMLQREKWLLSATARFQPTKQYRLDVLGFAERVIEEGKVSEDNSLVIQSNGIGSAGGVSAAYAPRPWLGFVFQGELGYADRYRDNGLAWNVGTLASIDLNPLYGVPLGFTVSGKQDSFVLENSDLTEKQTSFGWGVAYTGRSDFSLNLETNHLSVPLIDSDDTIGANMFRFNLRYYF